MERETIEPLDPARGRRFLCDLWHPLKPGEYPLVAFSHGGGGNRRSAAFLCRHLAGHGCFVAAMDHSELVAPELSRPDGESEAQRSARIAQVIASRVPDLRFLLDYLLTSGARAQLGAAGRGSGQVRPDRERIGLVGHSFGGWTVLATLETESRVGSVVALAPGGSSNPRPGILPLSLSFAWRRTVPTLYLAGDEDVMIPASAVAELFERTPGPSRMFVLHRADHQHFVDDVEGEHEAIRAASLPGEAAWIPAAMRPIGELVSGAQAHLFTRGLTLAHLDATLRQSRPAELFLEGDVAAELAARGVEGMQIEPQARFAAPME